MKAVSLKLVSDVRSFPFHQVSGIEIAHMTGSKEPLDRSSKTFGSCLGGGGEVPPRVESGLKPRIQVPL